MEEKLTSHDSVIDFSQPLTPPAENDCRINCTNSRSLRSIVDITHTYISELADALNSNDNRAQFISQFIDTFKNSLKENIVVNGLPPMLDENSELTPPEKEHHMHVVDDAMFSKISKCVAGNSYRRKFRTSQCARIFQLTTKYDRENIKNTKMRSFHPKSKSKITPCGPIKMDRIKMVQEVCDSYKTIQESAQLELQKREVLIKKISLARSVKK